MLMAAGWPGALKGFPSSPSPPPDCGRPGPPRWRRSSTRASQLSRASIGDLTPERILADRHGVFADADAALVDALAGARRRFPRAAVEHGPAFLRGALDAVRE